VDKICTEQGDIALDRDFHNAPSLEEVISIMVVSKFVNFMETLYTTESYGNRNSRLKK